MKNMFIALILLSFGTLCAQRDSQPSAPAQPLVTAPQQQLSPAFVNGEITADSMANYDDEIPDLWWIVPISSVLALLIAASFYKKIIKADAGDEKIHDIANFISSDIANGIGAQYRAGFALFTFIFIALLAMSISGLQSLLAPLAFVSGGFLVILSNKVCLKLVSSAAAPIVQACHQGGKSDGLNFGLRAGSAAGLTVIGIASFGVCGWYWTLDSILYTANNLQSGVSWMGHCIVPADSAPQDKFIFISNILLLFSFGVSVQAIFSGISGAGNRHHYVLGIVANIFAAFVTTIAATCTIGTVLPTAAGDIDEVAGRFITPMLITGIGTIVSIIILSMVKFKASESPQNMRRCLLACFAGANFTIAGAMVYLVYMGFIDWGMFFAANTGIVAGILIGQSDEYYSINNILNNSNLPALPPPLGQNAIILSATLLCSFGFAGGFKDFYLGFYGISLAATGLLAGSIIPLAAAVCNSAVANSANIAKMSSLPRETIDKVCALSAIEQSPANLSRSFSAVATAICCLALPAVFVITAKTWCVELSQQSDIDDLDVAGEVINKMTIPDFMMQNQMFILNPFLLAGMIIGGMLPFFLHALLRPSVENHAKAGKTLLVTAFTVFAIPVSSALILGTAGTIGLVIGTIFCGIMLTMNSNITSGGDINYGNGHEKLSRLPFMEYQNPAIHILLFSVPMALIVIVPAVIKFSPIVKQWLNIQV